MSIFKQIGAVTTVALEALPQRLGTSLIAVIGTATVASVLISVLAVATGFGRAAAKAGSPDRAIILGGLTEASSNISRANVATIADAPGLADSASGMPMVSAELLEFVPLTERRTGVDVYVAVRGVGPEGLVLRPEIHVVAGRRFQPGKHEVIVSRTLEYRLDGLGIGSGIRLLDGDWRVVGIFSSGGDAHDSEILTDASSLMSAYHRNAFNSMTVQLASPQDFTRFSAALMNDPALSVQAEREVEYYAKISRPISQLLKIIAYGIGSIMAFGAMFGALNTMYATVGARRTEIATLRAIGFDGMPVIASVVIEALLLGIVGALLGAVVAWVLINGSTISMMGPLPPSQVTFGVEVGPRLILIGTIFALGIAAVGGGFAARRALLIPVAAAMQAT